MVPEQYVAESLVEALRNEGVEGKRILLPAPRWGRDALRVGLEAAGAQVDEAPLYRALTPSGSRDKARALLAEGMDIVTFTSSSTVRNLIDLLDGDASALQGATIACIGPITASTAREMGLTVHAQAAEYTHSRPRPGVGRPLRARRWLRWLAFPRCACGASVRRRP